MTSLSEEILDDIEINIKIVDRLKNFISEGGKGFKIQKGEIIYELKKVELRDWSFFITILGNTRTAIKRTIHIKFTSSI